MSDTYFLILSDGNQYPYQVIPSKRAKYIRIKLSREGALSVTLPPFTNSKQAHDFVKSKRHWVEKNLKNITPEEEAFMPESLDLKLLGEYWNLIYEVDDNLNESTLQLKERLVGGHKYLVIYGSKTSLIDHQSVIKLLNQWCRKKAKKIFNQMLQNLAELHGFHFQRLSIRAQKTRWGSCSHQKNINLNCKLLFMPEAVVKYVMIHELCHTIEMNHSTNFWSLVEECDPHYQDHKKQLKALGKSIVI